MRLPRAGTWAKQKIDWRAQHDDGSGGRGHMESAPRPRAQCRRHRQDHGATGAVDARLRRARVHVIPGARETFEQLRAGGLRRFIDGQRACAMMAGPARAAEQGYTPEHVVLGRNACGPSFTLMIYKACAELGVWRYRASSRLTTQRLALPKAAAGAFTVGVASGNALGLSPKLFRRSLHSSERAGSRRRARRCLTPAPTSPSIPWRTIPALHGQAE